MSERLLTLDEIAAYLDTSPDDVRRWTDTLELPAQQLDGEYRFSATDVGAWITHGLQLAFQRELGARPQVSDTR